MPSTVREGSARYACSIAQLVIGLAPIMGWPIRARRGQLDAVALARFVKAHRKSVQRWLDWLQLAGLISHTLTAILRRARLTRAQRRARSATRRRRLAERAERERVRGLVADSLERAAQDTSDASQPTVSDSMDDRR